MSGAGGEHGSISERVYRLLMRAYPKEFREMYGRQMEQAFLDLCREETRRGGVGLARFWVRVGLDLVSSAIVERRRAEAKEIAVRDYKMAYRSAVGVALAAAFLLAWMDLAVSTFEEPDSLAMMAPLGFFAVPVIGAVIAYKATKTYGIAYRAAVGIAFVTAFLLAWTNLAVGVIGSEDNLANLMYVAVPAIGIIGAVIVRFRPLGMARALFATALAQGLVAGIALIFGLGSSLSPPVEILGVNGFFVALFLGSAWLFRNAARVQSPSGAGPEG